MTEDQFKQSLQDLWRRHQAALEENLISARAKRDHPCWLWNVYLMSICTNGGSQNYECKRDQYGIELNWDRIVRLCEQDRKTLFSNLPNLRRHSLLAPALNATFQRIRQAGGPGNLAGQYDELTTAAVRMKFWKSFAGIGEKYSRNIPMDIGDELFTEHIALDSRINDLIDRVDGAPRRSCYRAREKFVVGLGTEAGIGNAWFLDRLLYRFHNEF